MKLAKLPKSLPFLITFIIIILLSIINQKDYVKLKILIWDTPSLSLGTYLALSAGTGYVLSYVVTITLANNNNSKFQQQIRFNFDNQKEKTNLYPQTNGELHYDNILIERDIKDPSPTINASFRVIGKTSRNNQSPRYDEFNEYNSSNFPEESSYNNNDQNIKYKNNNEILNDWEDDTYINW